VSKYSVDFVVDVPYNLACEVLQHITSYWVENIQEETSSLAKAILAASGNNLASAINDALAKKQGVKNPARNVSKISIPASVTTAGGEMTVTLDDDKNGGSKVTINGRTLGLLGGTLRKSVFSLQEYLVHAIPDYVRQHNALAVSKDASNNEAKVDLSAEIEHLADLQRRGLINEEEYSAAKRKLLL